MPMGGSSLKASSNGFYGEFKKSMTKSVYLHGFYTDQNVKDIDASLETKSFGVGAQDTVLSVDSYRVFGFVEQK